MRDIFDDIIKRRPVDLARQSLRPALRPRFYREARADGHNAVRLDGKPARTPAGKPLAGPTPALAGSLAMEWSAQREAIDPAAMPLTRLAYAIIDAVAERPGPVAAEIEKYLGADLVFYRAEGPPSLLARQTAHWDPLLDFARDALGARFVLGQGVTYVAQPPAAIAAAARAIPTDPWRLGAVSTLTTLTGSALIALALAKGGLEPDAAWSAAHVDEDWQMAQWGADEIAMAGRAARFAEFQAAVTVLRLVPPA